MDTGTILDLTKIDAAVLEVLADERAQAKFKPLNNVQIGWFLIIPLLLIWFSLWGETLEALKHKSPQGGSLHAAPFVLLGTWFFFYLIYRGWSSKRTSGFNYGILPPDFRLFSFTLSIGLLLTFGSIQYLSRPFSISGGHWIMTIPWIPVFILMLMPAFRKFIAGLPLNATRMTFSFPDEETNDAFITLEFPIDLYGITEVQAVLSEYQNKRVSRASGNMNKDLFTRNRYEIKKEYDTSVQADVLQLRFSMPCGKGTHTSYGKGRKSGNFWSLEVTITQSDSLPLTIEAMLPF